MINYSEDFRIQSSDLISFLFQEFPFSTYMYEIVNSSVCRIIWIIKVFRSERKTLLLFFGFFLRSFVSTEDLTVILRFLFLYIIIFFSYSISPIFRDGVYWSRKTENNFSCDDVSSSPRYWRISYFQGVVLLRDLLRKKTQDIFFKFSRMIDKGLKFVPFESRI